MVCLRPEEVGDSLVHKWVTLPHEAPIISEGLTWHLDCTLSRAALRSRLICYNSHPRSHKGELDRLQPREGGGLGEMSVPLKAWAPRKSPHKFPVLRPEPAEDKTRGVRAEGAGTNRDLAVSPGNLRHCNPHRLRPGDTARRRLSPLPFLSQMMELWVGSVPGDRWLLGPGTCLSLPVAMWPPRRLFLGICAGSCTL